MKSVCLLLVVTIFLSGCSTTIRSYHVSKTAQDNERKGGIPYFMPKPVLKINEPIELKRTETFYALISLNGLETFLLKIDSNSYQGALTTLSMLPGYDPKAAYNLIPVPNDPFFQSRRIHNTDQSTTTTTSSDAKDKGTVTNSKNDKSDNTEEYSVPPNKSSVAAIQLYQPKDAAKSIEVVLVPDYEREYELVIKPSKFASSNISITLTDGWKLSAIGAMTGENQLVSSLTDLAKSALSAQTDIRKAVLTKEQAIEVAKLTAAAASTATPTPPAISEERIRAGDKQPVNVKILGFVKQVEAHIVKPGLYDMSMVFTNGTFNLPTEKVEYWVNADF